MKAATLCLVLIVALSALPAAAQDCMCGDVDCNGAWNAGDAAYLLNYLFGGGPPPVIEPMEYANWDHQEILTIADVWHILKFVFGEHPGPICPPPYPPLEPVVDSSIILYYTDWIPSGASSGIIVLTLHSDEPANYYGLSLPLKIRVDGEIPVIDSVAVLYEFFVDHSIDIDSGYVAIGAVPFYQSPQGYPEQIAMIYVTVPAESGTREVTLDWVNLTPVQAPTQDNSIIPMIYFHPASVFLAVEPLLQPHCCMTPGDANMDGSISISDAVFNLQCIFAGCIGHPCEKHLDANCDGDWNVSDVVHLINYIFRGGDPPCCL